MIELYDVLKKYVPITLDIKQDCTRVFLDGKEVFHSMHGNHTESVRVYLEGMLQGFLLGIKFEK